MVLIHFGRPPITVSPSGFCSGRSQLDTELLHGYLRCWCLRTTPGKTVVEKAVALCLKERASQPASEVPSLVAFAKSLHFSAPCFPVAGVWSLHTGRRKGVGMCELHHTGTIRYHNGLLLFPSPQEPNSRYQSITCSAQTLCMSQSRCLSTR